MRPCSIRHQHALFLLLACCPSLLECQSDKPKTLVPLTSTSAVEPIPLKVGKLLAMRQAASAAGVRAL
eukprot:1160787-Pelagomonas_calceolata.AAC.5